LNVGEGNEKKDELSLWVKLGIKKDFSERNGEGTLIFVKRCGQIEDEELSPN